MEGEREGLIDGDSDGLNEALGLCEGEREGLIDGETDGLTEGEREGDTEGDSDGEVLPAAPNSAAMPPVYAPVPVVTVIVYDPLCPPFESNASLLSPDPVRRVPLVTDDTPPPPVAVARPIPHPPP